VTDVPRNVPDSILARLPKNGGVVMVTFVPGFVSKPIDEYDQAARARFREIRATVTDTGEARRLMGEWRTAHPRPQATIKDVADHIDHVRQVAGVDHVGIGSDFDGIDETPVGLEDSSKYPALFAELIRRGWSDADLKKLAGQNLLRAMRGAEATARRLQQTTRPSTRTIDQLDGRRSAPAT
jgi:membrane dipeptidase